MISAIFFTWFGAATVWTVNALRKAVPPGRPFPPLWLPGMLVSELAPWYFMARTAIAALMIWAGALELPIGVAGLVLFAFSQIGLIILMSRSVRAAADAGVKRGWLGLWKVAIKLPDGVTITTEVPYSDDFTMDVYKKQDLKNAPTLIYLHPGSWMRGRPGRQARPLLYGLADRGWVILDLRYPLSPVATFPQHLIAVKRAIAWAKEHGAELGIDPTRVAIGGASSGAHLAALAALTWDRLDLQPGFEQADTSVIACAPHYGIYDLLIRNSTRYDWPFISKHVMKASPQEAPGLYELGSPIDLVRPDAPPFFAVHGDFDSVVLVEESRHFVDAITQAGGSVTYHEVHGAQHGYDAFGSLRSRVVGALVRDFFIGEALSQFNPESNSIRDSVRNPDR